MLERCLSFFIANLVTLNNVSLSDSYLYPKTDTVMHNHCNYTGFTMWRAVGSTVVTSAVIGSVWYHPAVFGSTWLKLAYPNTDKSSVKPGPMVYPVTTVSQLAASAILYEVLQ